MPYRSLWDKLNAVKSKVKKWQKTIYIRLFNRIKECEEELGAPLNCHVPTCVDELNNFINKKRELSIKQHHLRVIEDSCLRQKSRIRWLRKGDLNTSFFHKVSSGQRCSSLI